MLVILYLNHIRIVKYLLDFGRAFPKSRLRVALAGFPTTPTEFTLTKVVRSGGRRQHSVQL